MFFKDVIGQEETKQRLIQEVNEGRIPHVRSLVHPVTVIRGRLRIIKQLFKPLFVKVKSFAPRQAETLPDGSNLQYFCRIGDRKKHSDLILYLLVR